jgi:2-polyprenyl-3-methyl-5-hydroxy-6-metoxy-1,4-benzoquinol methylase
MGEVAGARICDLACGEGRVARYLADMGARVVGIDLSAKLLEIARRHEAAGPRGVEYRHADARGLPGALDSAFDGVVCNMALMDIADLEPALQSVARILRPRGWFVFSILHPCTNTARSGEMATPEGVGRFIGRYFSEGHWRSDTRTGPPGKVGAYHRTLSTYVNALTDAGFALERMREPQADGSLAERWPGWAEAPAVLVARCRKA